MPNIKVTHGGRIAALVASLLVNVWGIYVVVTASNISSWSSAAKLNSHDMYYLVPILLAGIGIRFVLCKSRNTRLLRAIALPLYALSLAMLVLGLFKVFYLTQVFGFVQASIAAARRPSSLASKEA